MAQIILLVEPSGASEMIVKGSPGSSCKSVSKFLTDNLGTVESEVLTEEYFTENQAQEVNTSAQRVRVVRN